MRIAGRYSIKNGEAVLQEQYSWVLSEIEAILSNVDANSSKIKISKEKTMNGKELYSPVDLNKKIKKGFISRGWQNKKVRCDYPTEYYCEGYVPADEVRGAFRDMDFVKDKVGVEVQFGKYSFMVYNVCAKMTIFHNLHLIDIGIEIVPMKNLAKDMSSGVSYFEQLVWDLSNRGEADIDIPVLVLGIDLDSQFD